MAFENLFRKEEANLMLFSYFHYPHVRVESFIDNTIVRRKVVLHVLCGRKLHVLLSELCLPSL